MRILSFCFRQRSANVEPSAGGDRRSRRSGGRVGGVGGVVGGLVGALLLMTAPSALAQVPQPPASSGQTTSLVVSTDQLGSVLSPIAPAPAASAPSPTAAPRRTSKPKSRSVTARLRNVVAGTAGAGAPAPTVAPTSTAIPDMSSSANASNGAIPDSVLAALRKCESNGNYAINSGNGYYGAYQFAASTWRKLGFTGLPHEASPATQDAAARKLQAQQGWAPWPSCTRSLGLR